MKQKNKDCQHLSVTNNKSHFKCRKNTSFQDKALSYPQQTHLLQVAPPEKPRALSGPAVWVCRGQWTYWHSKDMFRCFLWCWAQPQGRESSCEESCTNIGRVKCKCCFLVTGQCHEPQTGTRDSWTSKCRWAELAAHYLGKSGLTEEICPCRVSMMLLCE